VRKNAAVHVKRAHQKAKMLNRGARKTGKLEFRELVWVFLFGKWNSNPQAWISGNHLAVR